MKTFILVILSLGFLLYSGCSKNEQQGSDDSNSEGGSNNPIGRPAPTQQTGYMGSVLETMDAGGYTYVKLQSGNSEIWLAGPETKIKVGDVITTPDRGSAMKNFSSKTLNRTFETIYFVNGISLQGDENYGATDNPHGNLSKESQPAEPMDFKGITLPKGGISIADLYKQKASKSGKQVTLRGKIVKVNYNIMGSNWYHIQDGSGKTGSNDLALTSSEKVDMGNTVLVKGAVTLNKDFGAGYKYDIIIEGAQVTKE